jgi:hypothetical protein
LIRQLGEVRAAVKDITLERTDTLLQVPSIELEELLAGWQSTSPRDHSSRQLSEIFRHASFGSSVMPGHTNTSSIREGLRTVSDVNAPEMQNPEQLDYLNNAYTVPLDELFLQGRDQHPLIESEEPQNVPRMSVEGRKRVRNMFDDRIALSRVEMFLTTEEIEEADFSRVKKAKQMKEDQVLALINNPLLKCKALYINSKGPLLDELMPTTITISHRMEGSLSINYTPFNHDTGYDPVEVLRAVSDSTSNLQPLPWSSFDSVPASDVRKRHSTTASE